MSKKGKLILRLLAGNADANFDLDDLVQILVRMGFEERKTAGSHRIFSKEGIEGIINLQKTKDGKAKTYQVKQVREFLVTNKLVRDE
jgi:predicted RNA binding protein YcfA (HicA-like mRNA interferase family)